LRTIRNRKRRDLLPCRTEGVIGKGEGRPVSHDQALALGRAETVAYHRLSGVALLTACAENVLPWSVTSRPLKSEPPTIDLAVGHKRPNSSPTLALFLSRLRQLGKKQVQTAKGNAN